MSKHIYITTALVFVLYFLAKTQNPATYVFPTPDPTPPNLTVDSYTRATSSIKLQDGFKYGFVTAGANKLLNLNISVLML